MKTKDRIKWIDAMRGFTMILVVFGHVASLSCGIDDAFTQFFLTFRMPLFFFVSGFIGYIPIEKFTGRFYGSRIKKKAFVQIVPTLIAMSVAVVWFDTSYVNYLNQSWGMFWFTICLFEMFVIYYTISLLGKFLNSKYFVIFALVVLSLMGVMHLVIGNRGGNVYHYFIIESLTKYFQFFTTGIIASMYFPKVEKYMGKDSVKTWLIAAFVLGYCLLYISGVPEACKKILHDVVLRYLGAFCVLVVFYSMKDSFNNEGTFAKALCFVGRRTLDIYLLHYFCLPKLGSIRPYLEGNPLIELIVFMSVSLIVVMICLAVSWVIRRSNTLAYFCFGSKQK